MIRPAISVSFLAEIERSGDGMTLKVIGAGLGRTGTLSLKFALEALGLGPCYHMMEVIKNPAAPGQWNDVADGRTRDWDAIFKGFNATVDWPSATYYHELADAYPDAKVILTERDPEAWFASTQATIFGRDWSSASDNIWEIMASKVVGSMFEGRMHDKDWVISVYLKHNAEVRRVIPKHRLLVYFAKDGWEPLCGFLGVPVPSEAMPSVNSTEDFRNRFPAAPAPN